MDLGLASGGDIRKLIDGLLAHHKEIYLPDVGIVVTTVNGAYKGALWERTPEFVILRTDLRRKLGEGENKGKSIYQYHYIALQSIVGVTFEMAE